VKRLSVGFVRCDGRRRREKLKGVGHHAKVAVAMRYSNRVKFIFNASSHGC